LEDCVRRRERDGRASPRFGWHAEIVPTRNNLLAGKRRVLMKPSVVALSIVFAACEVSAQARVWQPSPGHTQVPIWPSSAPATRSGGDAETMAAGGSLVAGRPWLQV